MLRFLCSTAFVLFCSSATAQGLPTTLELTTDKSVFPAQEFLLSMMYKDAQGVLLKNFDTNHEKLNHTIIVSRDLETFAHVHPELTSTGRFVLDINTPPASYDNDNADAAMAVSKPGQFLFFSEVIASGTQQVSLVRSMLKAHGNEIFIPLKLDTIADGKIVKYFNAKSVNTSEGDRYKITLTVKTMPDMIHFNFKVEEWMEAMGHYMTVSDLENWLGMPGHGILISESGGDANSKVFKHLHANIGTNDDGHDGGHHHNANHGDQHVAPPSAISGKNIEFIMIGTNVPPSGTYKLWGQFKHQDNVLTFPFVIQL